MWVNVQEPRAGAVRAREARGPRPWGRGTGGSETPDPRGEGPVGTREPRPQGRGTGWRVKSPDPRGEGQWGDPRAPTPGERDW